MRVPSVLVTLSPRNLTPGWSIVYNKIEDVDKGQNIPSLTAPASPVTTLQDG
jgi:hypothetical protein